MGDLEDEFEDEFLKKYKEQRMAEMMTKKEKPKFGWVREISKAEYKREVNEAPKGVWVILLLYQEYIESCQQMKKVMDEAAVQYPEMKFLKSVATKCIENYKDVLCPTLVIY